MARQRLRNRRQSRSNPLNSISSGLQNAQLGLLLATVVIVPLVVLPESNFVDITSTPKTTILRILGTLLAGILLSRLFLASTTTDQNPFVISLRSIRANRPALFVLGSIAAVMIISLLSTVLSILPHQSWWGRVPAGFEAGEFTALMYVVLSISAFVSLRDHGSGKWLWKAITATTLAAGLVGFFQFLGWSPLDISSTHSTRLTGTNGNPIFFGAMLIVISPVALGYLISRYQASSEPNRRRWLAALGTTAFVVSVSLIATVSRGPWVGAFTGGVVAVALLAIYGRSRLNLAPVTVIVVSALTATLLVTFVDPTPAKPTATNEDASSPNTSSAFDGVGRTSTLDLRVRYWNMSTEMSIDRDPVPHTNDAPQFVRFLFGYGPDTFRFAGTYFADSTTFTRRLTAAHNDPINRLVEQGLLGFLAWMMLWGSIAYGCYALIRRSGSTTSNTGSWIAIALAAAFTARFVEQLFGSPTPGGVLIFWVLAGALAAMLLNTDTPSHRSDAPQTTSGARQYATYVGITFITIASIVVAWDKGANYLIANQMASFQYRPGVVTADEALKRLEQAANLAPDVPRYWHDLAELEHGRAESTEDPQIKAAALSRAYEYDLKGYEANPLEVNSIYKLAFSAWEAGGAGRPELRQEAVRLYERLTEIIPSDKLAKERLQTLEDFLSN